MAKDTPKDKSMLDKIADYLPDLIGGKVVQAKRERKERLKNILRSGETKDDSSKRPQGEDTPR